jgi:hypothetical protein
MSGLQARAESSISMLVLAEEEEAIQGYFETLHHSSLPAAEEVVAAPVRLLHLQAKLEGAGGAIHLLVLENPQLALVMPMVVAADLHPVAEAKDLTAPTAHQTHFSHGPLKAQPIKEESVATVPHLQPLAA